MEQTCWNHLTTWVLQVRKWNFLIATGTQRSAAPCVCISARFCWQLRIQESNMIPHPFVLLHPVRSWKYDWIVLYDFQRPELSDHVKALAASICQLFHQNASTTESCCTLQQLTAKTHLLCKFFKLDRFFPPFYLHVARTRRCHPMEVGAACAAAGAAGLHLAGEARNISSLRNRFCFWFFTCSSQAFKEKESSKCCTEVTTGRTILRICTLSKAGTTGSNRLSTRRHCGIQVVSIRWFNSLECSHVHVPEADLFRADVEQAIGASSAVQDRLIVVWLGTWTHSNVDERCWAILCCFVELSCFFLQ